MWGWPSSPCAGSKLPAPPLAVSGRVHLTCGGKASCALSRQRRCYAVAARPLHLTAMGPSDRSQRLVIVLMRSPILNYGTDAIDLRGYERQGSPFATACGCPDAHHPRRHAAGNDTFPCPAASCLMGAKRACPCWGGVSRQPAIFVRVVS